MLSRATEKLALDWPEEPRESRASKLDERFLSGAHSKPERRKLPFFSDLHQEISRSWKQPFSSRLTNAAAADFTNLVVSVEQGYTAMPVVEDTLASHLSPSLAPSWKSRPLLPSKPCRTTSALIGKSYIAAGQAGMALHTMAILQAYQAEVLKEMDEGTGLTPEAVKELRRATDLALRATKHTARAVGRSMAASVAAERHLWLNLTEIREKEKVFLLDAPISQSGLFGEAVSAVVDKFRSAKTQSQDPGPTGLPLRLIRVIPDLRVGMRRAVSPLRGEVRPLKHFCPPRTRSHHSNLSQPPIEAWCADLVHPHFYSDWQLGDASVFPPLQPVRSPPAGRVLGDTAVSLLQCTDPVPATRQSSTSLSIIGSDGSDRMSFICHIHNYTKYNEEWNVFSAFNPSKCTHLEQWAADCAAPGEQSWTSCRSRDSNPQPWVTSDFKSNALSIRPTTASWTRTPRALLHGGGRRCFQAFSTPHLRYVFPFTTLCFLYRTSFTNGSVYRGFSAQFGPATHFSLGKIPPASTGFIWQ